MEIVRSESRWIKVKMKEDEFREKLDLPPGLIVQVHVWGYNVEITLSEK